MEESETEQDYQAQEEYEVECVLAERTNEDGEPEYLIKWSGYNEPEDNTWEPKENIIGGEILTTWTRKKVRQARGAELPFDVDEWENRVSAAEAREEQRRAQKRKDKKDKHPAYQALSSDSDSDEAAEVGERVENGKGIGTIVDSTQRSGFKKVAGIFRSNGTAQSSGRAETTRKDSLPSSSTYTGTARPDLARPLQVSA